MKKKNWDCDQVNKQNLSELQKAFGKRSYPMSTNGHGSLGLDTNAQ